MIVDEANIFGLGALESVSLENGDFLTLAQNSDGVLSLLQNRKRVKLKFHSVEDEEDTEELGDKFIVALEKFLRG